MANRPQVRTLTASSVEILNAIRDNATVDYKQYVPIATADAEVIKKIGAILMDFPSLRNEFIGALVNRIGKVMITSKMFSNNLAPLKKGMLDMGETIEEVFVEIAKPHQYDPSVAEDEVFKREIPDVKSAFHVVNYQKFYKRTIERQELKKAFLSIDGVTDLISRFIDSMYSASAYDEFLVTKYLIARALLDGRLTPVQIPTLSHENSKDIVADIKGVSNALTFPNREHNAVGVLTKTDKADQYIIMTSGFDASMDVDVLASAFNMDKVQFMGNRIVIDSFGALDKERLNELLAENPGYVALTDAELLALESIPCVLMDKNWFMIFDYLIEMEDQKNGEGLYWQYWLHTWKVLSTSPFAQAVAFIPDEPTVTNLTVSPSSATLTKGGKIDLTATVTTSGFAPKTVTYTSNKNDVLVGADGMVMVKADATSTSATITVKSTYDPSKTATCTITIQ